MTIGTPMVIFAVLTVFLVGSKYMIYGTTSKKLQENVLLYSLILLGPESNISKVGQNWAITKGLNVTSKKMAAVI